MNSENRYIPSLNDLVRFLRVNTVFAKSDSCSRPTSPRRDSNVSNTTVDTSGGGDAPSPRRYKFNTNISDRKTRTAGDRGKTGAGVTGSRKEGSNAERAPDGVPVGATNPGLLRYIHNAARYRLPQCFEGACVSVKQGFKSNWVMGHSMTFSSVSPGGYKVLISYAEKNKEITVPYFIMEAAPGGQMSCEFRVGPTGGTRATVVAQIANGELLSFESIFDVYFNSFTTSIIAVNKEFIALHYLKAITEQISLGAEIVTRQHGTELNSASAAARWSNEENSVSATLGNRGLDLCYAKEIKPFLTVASMLEVGFAVRRAVATLAYEWNTKEWTARGSIDSDGLVGATLQRALGGKRAQLACAVSALLNHPNDKFRLGFGIQAVIE